MHPSDQSECVPLQNMRWRFELSRRCLRIISGKRHRFNAIAIGIKHERCIITYPIVRTQTRRAVGAASGIQCRRMERIDIGGRFRPKTDMNAALGRDLRHIGTKIDPELGIALAETNRPGPRHQSRKPERRQRQFVKAR